MGPLRGTFDRVRQAPGLPRPGALQRQGHAPARGAGDPGSRRDPRAETGGDVDATGFRAHPQRACALGRAARRAHRDDLARRDRLDQSRRLGQPARTVRARGDEGRLQVRAHPLDLCLGIRAEGPAHRARHRRDEPLHPALGARPLALAVRRAADSDRHTVRSLHRPRPRCVELRLLPGRPLHPRRDAVRRDARARGRRASVDRHAADRARPRWARLIRAGLRRRALGHPALGFRLCSEDRRRRIGRARGRGTLAARRNRRLGLSAPVDPHARAAAPRDEGKRSSATSSTGLTG